MHHLDVESCQCMSTTLTLPCSSFRVCDMTLHALARYARPSVFALCNGRRSSNRACLGAVCDWARSPAAFVVCPWRSSRLFFCFAHTRNSDETSEGYYTNSERDREARITGAKTTTCSPTPVVICYSAWTLAGSTWSTMVCFRQMSRRSSI